MDVEAFKLGFVSCLGLWVASLLIVIALRWGVRLMR